MIRIASLPPCLAVWCLALLCPTAVAEPPAALLYPYEESGRWGYLDASGAVVVPARFEHAGEHDPHTGLAPAGQDGQVGYVDRAGAWRIPPRYAEGSPFREGWALVATAEGERAFVDARGERVLALPATHTWCRPFSSGLAAVQVEEGETEAARWGFMDREGRLVVAPQFSWAEPFSEGLAVVMMGGRAGLMGGGRWGFADSSGAVVLPCDYEAASRFSEGLAAVRQAGEWGYIDAKGRPVVPCEFATAWPFSDGLGLVKVSSAEGGGWGFVDRFGTRVIPATLAAARPFSEQLAAARRADGRWGYIDPRGAWAIPPQFDDAEAFRGALGRVQWDGKAAYVDRRGELVWPTRPNSR